MAIKTALLSVGGTVAIFGLMTGTALAGSPSHCGGPGCDTGVAYVPTPTGFSGPTTIENRTPYDFLDSVHFQRSPHVSITRVHSLSPTVSLADRPVGFTQGCHPESTTYCRTGQAGHSPVTPTYTPPAPVMQPAPVAMPPRIVATGSGFDPSKFTPRIYGDPYTITPGIAYLPTTVVDRNPYRAQAVLDAGPGGVTPALTGMPIGPMPTPRPYSTASSASWSTSQATVQPRMMPRQMMQPQMMVRPMMPRPMYQAPMMPRPMMQPSIPTGYPGAAGAPYQMQNGRYGSTVGADGTYWEKVSGPTQFGNTVASQVICKRRAHNPAPMRYPAPYPTGPNIYPSAPCNAQVAPHRKQSSRY